MMTFRSKCRVWLRASTQSASLAGLVLIAVSWLVAAFVSSVEYEKTMEGALKQSDGLVRLLEQNTVDILERFDRTLLLLRKSFEDDPAHFDLRNWAARTALVSDETLQLSLIGADGFQIASTTDYRGPPLYLGDREHFRKQLDLGSDKLFISEPVRGRASGQMSLQFSRRVRGPDGRFGGVIVISITPDFIGRFYRTVDLGSKGSILLRNLDGVILAAQGLSADVVGRKVKQQAFLDALARSRSGHYWGGGAVDGTNRLVAYRTSGKFPLTFAVGLAESDVLSGYREHRTAYFAAAAIITLIILAAIAFTIRHQVRLDRNQYNFDAALANMSNGLSMFDADGNLMVWNDRYVEIYGMSPEVIRPGASINAIVEHRKQVGNLDLDVEVYIAEFRQNLIDFGRGSSTSRLDDGRTVSVVNTAIAGGGWVAIHEDITDRIHHEESVFQQAAELARTNLRFDTALSNMTQGLCMFDDRKQLVVWNDRYGELYQVPPHLLKSGTPHEAIVTDRIVRGLLKGDTSEPAVKTRVAELVQLPTDCRRVDEMADGRFLLLARQSMEGGGWVATVEDITERRRAEAEIAHLARHDVMTGLANRAEFNAKLEEASKRLKRNGGAVTVMMIDLDKFKAVNDTLGHPAGDQLLVEVSTRLKSTIRETDILARLGGDEFAIIQEGGASQYEGAAALALRIIDAISRPFDLKGHQASVGTSIGIAMAPENGVEPEELLKRADLALYEAKAGGRNDFRVFQAEMLEVADIQRSAESELRDAIARDEFELHYQPMVDVKQRRLCGVEALVRWRHPTKGLIAPDQFIPLAESTGLIVPLGEWVLRQACTDAASWPAHVKVAINISAVQFKTGNLFDVILCTLVETGLSAERLELEITETSLLENQDAHLTTIRQLKNLGIAMALDDFGVGYSSVSYLTNFPFDKIKIDKSFTQGALNRRDSSAVVSSVLALAQGLGIVTTAEGVETEEQFEYMRKAGVNLVQGYLFGWPVPISQLDLHNTNLPKERVA
jgi:diguanylate cyclase (GGDEF)-like protein